MGFFAQTTKSLATPFSTYTEVEPFQADETGNTIITKVLIQSIFDNLSDQVDFKYTLATEEETVVVNGVYTLDGELYPTWDATKHGAYKIVCDALNIKLKDNE